MSPKPNLEPIIRILFWGKFIDMCGRRYGLIRGFLQVFAQWIRLGWPRQCTHTGGT